MDKKTTKMLKAILQCVWTLGEAYAVKNLYSSDLKPFYKWNLIIALGAGLPKQIMDSFRAIDEFGEALDEPDEVETPETEET